MRKILVTGGAGFIGAHLASRLVARGNRVDLLDNFARGAEDAALRRLTDGPGVRMLRADLAEADAWRGLDRDYAVIFHLAATVGVANVVERPFEVLRTNAALTGNALLLARAQQGLARFVFASTSEAYGGTAEYFDLPMPTPETVPLAVADPRRPRSAYMISKIFGEAMTLQSGVPATIVRPHNVYGPRMGLSHVIPELLCRAREAPEGGKLVVHSPDHRRMFCYVDDAVEDLVRLSEASEAEGQTVNVGDDTEEVTMRELAHRIESAIGKRLTIVDGEVTPGSPLRRFPDLRLLRRIVGRRSAVPLDEGIRRTAAWYRDDAPGRDAGVR